MSPELLARLLLALALAAVGGGLYWAWTARQMRRLRRGAAAQRAPGLETLRPGTPAIVYFTAPSCAVCRTTQRPTLARLQADLGEAVQVVELDAAAQPAVADYWGVLSLPTTFVLDASGQPRCVNHGLAGAARLRRQLAEVQVELAAAPAAPSFEPAPLRAREDWHAPGLDRGPR